MSMIVPAVIRSEVKTPRPLGVSVLMYNPGQRCKGMVSLLSVEADVMAMFV